jgi:hypothetical protein
LSVRHSLVGVSIALKSVIPLIEWLLQVEFGSPNEDLQDPSDSYRRRVRGREIGSLDWELNIRERRWQKKGSTHDAADAKGGSIERWNCLLLWQCRRQSFISLSDATRVWVL